MRLTLECEQEPDGRWIAEAPQMPGVIAYGPSPLAAIANVEALACRVIADRLEHGLAPQDVNIALPGVFPQAVDRDLLEQARELLGSRTDEAVFREALLALIERESARALARMGGSQPDLPAVRRRRPDVA